MTACRGHCATFNAYEIAEKQGDTTENMVQLWAHDLLQTPFYQRFKAVDRSNWGSCNHVHLRQLWRHLLCGAYRERF